MSNINWREIWFDPNWRHQLTNQVIGGLVLAAILGIFGSLYLFMTKTHLSLFWSIVIGAGIGGLIGSGIWLLRSTVSPSEVGTSPATPSTTLSASAAAKAVPSASTGETMEHMAQGAAAIRQKFDSPSERDRLQKAYSWGYRIYGVDAFGGTVSYVNRLSNEYGLEWDKIEVTTDPKRTHYKVTVPEFRSKEGILRNIEFGGSLAVGPGPGAFIGNLSVWSEILEVKPENILVLIGVNREDFDDKLRILHRRLDIVKSSVERFHHQYDGGKWDEIWEEAHPELRAKGSREDFYAKCRRFRTDAGRILKSEVDKYGDDPSAPGARVIIGYKTDFEKKGAGIEVFTFSLVDQKAELIGVKRLGSPPPETPTPPSRIPDKGASPLPPASRL
jgi:hypothetical protein